jgi:hypothetical protein
MKPEPKADDWLSEALLALGPQDPTILTNVLIQLAINDYQNGNDYLNIEDTLHSIDIGDDGSWRNYQMSNVLNVDWTSSQVTVDRFGQRFPIGDGWTLTRRSICRDSPARIKTLLLEGVARDPGWGDNFIGLERETADGVTLWMSDTKAEILDHLQAIRAIDKLCESLDTVQVLINGFGLGMIAAAALSHPKVSRVDVVEIDPTLIHAMSQFWDDPRLHVHEGDAYTINLPGRWDYAWHDIWPDISDLNVPQMDALLNKYRGRVTAQGCWEENNCRDATKWRNQ